MSYLPIERMTESLAVATNDGDTALTIRLLEFGEFLTKLTVSGVVAGVSDDPERRRYALISRLVRADGLGEWADVLDSALTGQTSICLAEEIRVATKQLTQYHQHSPDDWLTAASTSLHRCLKAVNPNAEPISRRLSLCYWFRLFVELRNVTKGHGIVNRLTPLVDDLQYSITSIAAQIELFQLPWAYLHQNLSGKYRVTPITDNSEAFDDLKREPQTQSYKDGVYIYLSRPVLVETILSDVEAKDFFVPNGAFNGRRYEMFSYITGDRQYPSAEPYLNPVQHLARSETHPPGLDVVGSCFANLPDGIHDYVNRPALEQELERILKGERYPVVTLHGRGGVGKTSLALRVLHNLTVEASFDAIIWFSARDIDLYEEGPKDVQPQVLRIVDVGRELMDLTEPDDDVRRKTKPTEYLATQLQRCDLGNTLFVFDNFETMANPAEIYSWLDTHIRPGNKMLITTRLREFKADYPIEVPGMQEEELAQLITFAARSLHPSLSITDRLIKDLYEESDGHPYIAKILLGDVARRGGKARVERIPADNERVLGALFDRTYRSLSAAAERVFLTLCGWRSVVPELALEAVIQNSAKERLNVADAIDELARSALIEVLSSENDGERHLAVPEVAAVFGRRKLNVSHLKYEIEDDVTILRAMGAAQKTDLRHGLSRRIERLFRHAAREVSEDENAAAKYLPILESIAQAYEPAWLLLADLHSEGGGNEATGKAARCVQRYLETNPWDVGAWEKLAYLFARQGAYDNQAWALVEMSQADPQTPYESISRAANEVNRLFSERALEKRGPDLDALLRPLIGVMTRRLQEATATDCSRLAWLHLCVDDPESARGIVQAGLERNPEDEHCRRLDQRLNGAGAR